jgi:hypothetical protein
MIFMVFMNMEPLSQLVTAFQSKTINYYLFKDNIKR